MCSLSKEQSILSRETIQNAFFSPEAYPLFRLKLFILYQALQRLALSPAYGALVVFLTKYKLSR